MYMILTFSTGMKKLTLLGSKLERRPTRYKSKATNKNSKLHRMHGKKNMFFSPFCKGLNTYVHVHVPVNPNQPIKKYARCKGTRSFS